MMHSYPRQKKIGKLSPTLSGHLNAYAAAASMAGVGLLAFSQPAQAEVIFTPVHVPFEGARTVYRLDLNNDGRSDFAFLLSNSVRGAKFVAGAESNGAEVSNAFIVDPGKNFLPLALKAGAPIGSAANFFGTYYGSELLAYATQKRGGNWIDVKSRYLGLKFLSHGKIYFGWARLSVQLNGKEFRAAMTGYAYENLPGRGIRAGQTSGTEEEPVFGLDSPATTEGNPAYDSPASANFKQSTLGMLALGASGVSLWRNDTY